VHFDGGTPLTPQHMEQKSEGPQPTQPATMDTSSTGAIARPMAAFSGFYESHKPPPSPLGGARGIVPAHREGHQNSQQSGFILHRRTVCCRPGGRRGNTERVVARWRHLVASIKALDLLHWAMCAVSHHRTAMAIEIASDGGAFVRRRRLFRLL